MCYVQVVALFYKFLNRVVSICNGEYYALKINPLLMQVGKD